MLDRAVPVTANQGGGVRHRYMKYILAPPYGNCISTLVFVAFHDLDYIRSRDLRFYLCLADRIMRESWCRSF